MFHFRFHQLELVLGALLLVAIGVRGGAPICTGIPPAKSDDCSKLIDTYLANDTTATIDGTGHAVISLNTCAVVVEPNDYVSRITNDYLARHGLWIYNACGNGALMAGFQTDDNLPTTCVLRVNSYVLPPFSQTLGFQLASFCVVHHVVEPPALIALRRLDQLAVMRFLWQAPYMFLLAYYSLDTCN